MNARKTENGSGPELVRVILGKRRVTHSKFARAANCGAGILLSLPTRHRPVLRQRGTPLDKAIWDASNAGPVLDDLISGIIEHYPEYAEFDILFALSTLERQGFLTTARSNNTPGIPYPGWRQFR